MCGYSLVFSDLLQIATLLHYQTVGFAHARPSRCLGIVRRSLAETCGDTQDLERISKWFVDKVSYEGKSVYVAEDRSYLEWASKVHAYHLTRAIDKGDGSLRFWLVFHLASTQHAHGNFRLRSLGTKVVTGCRCLMIAGQE